MNVEVIANERSQTDGGVYNSGQTGYVAVIMTDITLFGVPKIDYIVTDESCTIKIGALDNDANVSIKVNKNITVCAMENHTITAADLTHILCTGATLVPYLDTGNNKVIFLPLELNGGSFTANTEFNADTLAAPVREGYIVNGKEVDIPTDGKLTGLKSTDKVVVSFGKIPLPSVSVDGEGGKVDADYKGNVTITPDEGYRIEKITINGKEVEIPADGKLTGLKPTDEVVVTFEKTITVDQFTDVKASEWYYESIKYAVDKGLFYGISDTEFSPNGTMTRGMLATVLYRMENDLGASLCLEIFCLRRRLLSKIKKERHDSSIMPLPKDFLMIPAENAAILLYCYQ